MPQSDFGGIYYPAGNQDALVPADWMQTVTDLDPKLNHFATDEVDRDNQYSNLPAGGQVSGPDGTVWVKTSDPPDAPTWLTTFSDTGIVTTGIVQDTTNWDLTSEWGRRRAGRTFIVFTMEYTGSDIVAPTSGNIGNLDIATVLGQWVPPVRCSVDGYYSDAAIVASINVNGVITLNAVTGSGVTISTGSIFRITCDFPSVD